jgi:hypothetical protein
MSQDSFSGLLSLKTAGCLVGAALVEVVFGTWKKIRCCWMDEIL